MVQIISKGGAKEELNKDLGVNEPDSKVDVALQELTKYLLIAAKGEALRRAPRTQIHFGNIPAPIREAFEAKATSEGMGLKEFFYHCLRAGGVDIPSYKDLDARRRS